MSHWSHTPPVVDVRLGELAEVFVDCREAFFETADRFHWTPEPDSIAAQAATALPSPDPLIVDPRGDTGHRLIAEVVQTYLLTAANHLGGLATLFVNGEVFFPPSMLIRAVIENCSHAMWVIGDEPTEDPETRLARAYLEEFLSTDEAKKTAGRLGAKTEPSYIAAHENYVRLKRQIITRFPGTTKSDLGNLTLAGQTLPRPEACVAWMYALLHRAAGSPIDERVALGIYGFLSNMTHPTLYPARQLRDWATDPATGHHVAFLRIDVGFLERQASSAVSAFYNALSYVTSYFGWDSAIKDDLTAKIDSAMPRFFND